MSNDTKAETLYSAAKDNQVALCTEFYGAAKVGKIFVNAKALLIAAENKSYEAFEKMLEISGEESCGVTSNYSIGLGEDWNKVVTIAQADERIDAAIKNYNKKVDENIGNIFGDFEF